MLAAKRKQSYTYQFLIYHNGCDLNIVMIQEKSVKEEMAISLKYSEETIFYIRRLCSGR